MDVAEALRAIEAELPGIREAMRGARSQDVEDSAMRYVSMAWATQHDPKVREKALLYAGASILLLLERMPPPSPAPAELHSFGKP